MRRGQYGRRIEHYSHKKYGGNVPIYLDTGSGTFTAVIQDLLLQDDDLATVRKMVDEALAKTFSLDWIPLIEIGFGSKWNNREDDARNSFSRTLDLSYSRYWIAKKVDGFWIQSSWDETRYPDVGKKVVQTGDRVARSRSFVAFNVYDRATSRHFPPADLKFPKTKKAEDRDETPTHYLPYSEPLWNTLKEIDSRIRALELRIIQTFGSDKKREELIANVNKLLPESAS